MSEDKSNDTTTSTTTTTSGSASSSPSMDTAPIMIDEARKTVKSGIKTSVDVINTGLASLEEVSATVSEPVVKGIHTVEKEAKWLGQEASHLYTVRREVGPWLIGGSTLLVGGFTAMRRGRLPGLATGAVAGFATYLGVYQLDLDAVQGAVKEGMNDLPFGFGKK
mmetsp:Transcript_25599/g.37423  ORF Transcript_25599/g.37423 Transcript_25599/m.37423 type:complete len:165 (-) Transcript_25599:47-541(-)|eukprot:CAMPEP_0194026926 /NCGR_PEP_ID=MMETSP0009_2-20130614/1172_1 /TAXON_ID=210454 /ORGANISM="Grammatophora oceanica, Strain CCMP 410" /LENGTH=164 /DNA_ID=CAMNT_0038665817 /DNA_START=150 /DNA_END=644 /DNA_ORIENTATION=+